MSAGIPPYVSYRTFENFLVELRARGVPSRIDRSILAHKSGTVQSQLILALQYLGLISDSGGTTQRLRSLIQCEGAARKKLLRETIESSYGFVFSSDFQLDSATSEQAHELFQRTGASGETVRRCLSFFLTAAKQSGIKISPYIKPHRGKTPSRLAEPTSKDTLSESKKVHPAGTRIYKRVAVRSGGSLVLELSLDIFELDPSDREFVFELIDKLNEYERSGQRSGDRVGKDPHETRPDFPSLR